MNFPFDYRKILCKAMSTGGDYADIFMEETVTNSVTLRDSEVNNAGRHIDCGVGIRVIKGDQTGYAYTESLEEKDLLAAAATAAGIASSAVSSDIVPAQDATPGIRNRYPVISSWDDMTLSSRIEYLKMLDSMIFSADERVVKVTGAIRDTLTTVTFVNSAGVYYRDVRPMASVTATCVMKDMSGTESGSASRSYRCGSEMLDEGLIKEIADECVSRTSVLFGAARPKGGELPVVMGAGGSGILLHEAIGHAFEADFNRKDSSIFSDCMGKRVCREGINVVDDGTVVRNRGAVNFDDEGVPGQKTYMVTDGILTSYLHDRISARFYGVDPTGNGRRESFRYMPIPRMRATYMENGNCSEEDLIRDIDYGIYADNFSNGQVQIGAGDFTFYVKSGRLIEKGRLTSYIKDINIIGNGPQALASIVAVADNLKIDDGTWTCGKGQYCPVSCGMPSALVEKLTVGGCN